MVKVVCPICGKIGVLEIRGNSRRVVHYYYENGKRVFVKHTVKREQWEQWEQKRRISAHFLENWCSGRDLNPGLRLERPEYLAGLYYRSLKAL